MNRESLFTLFLQEKKWGELIQVSHSLRSHSQQCSSQASLSLIFLEYDMTVSRKQVAESSLPCYRMSQLLRGEIGWFLLWFHLTVSQRIRQATLFEKDFVSKWKKKNLVLVTLSSKLGKSLEAYCSTE